jgi:hypothetical protein
MLAKRVVFSTLDVFHTCLNGALLRRRDKLHAFHT